MKEHHATPSGCCQSWGWKPDADEFGPDLIVFDDNGEDRRFTGMPYLAVEVLSSYPARDIFRKAAKYAATGLQRYWIIDPNGPLVIVYRLIDGVLVEQGRHGPSQTVTLDVGSAEIAFDPAQLLA